MAAALLASTCLSAPAVRAQDATWLQSPGSNNLATGTNWSTGTVPTGTATFGTSATTSLGFSSALAMGELTFNAGAPVYQISATAGGGLTLNGAGITNNASNTPILVAGLLGNFTFANSASAGNARLENTGGAVTFNNTSSGGSARYVGAGGTLNLSALTSGGMTLGSIEGSSAVNLGANQLAVGGNNRSTTQSGDITGTGGSLVKVGTGTLTLAGANTYSGGTTISGGTLAGNTTSLQGNIVNSAALVIDGDGTFAGDITGAGSVTKTGAGVLYLMGVTHSYTGLTTVDAGTLDVGYSFASNAMVVNGGAGLNLRGIYGTYGGNASGAGSVAFIASALTLTGAYSHTGGTTFLNGAYNLGAAGGPIMSIGGAVNFINGGFTLDVNVVNADLTRVTTIRNLGVTLNFLNDSSAASATITNEFSRINFNDASTAANATIYNTPGRLGTVNFNGSSTAGNAVITNGTVNFNGGSTAGNAVITDGAVNFTGSSTAGNAVIAGGTVNFTGTASGGNATLINATVDISQLASTGTTAGSISGTGTISLGSKSLTVGSNNRDTVFGGVIADGGIGGGVGGSLVKTGDGTLTLSGANTYTGPTTINGGRLAVNGSIASNVTVGSAGNLGGSGIISGAVVNYGVLSPGNSIGTLNVAGSYTQAAGSIYQVEVNSAGQSDRLNVTGAPGTATLNGGAVQVLPVSGGFGRSTTYTILNATGGVTGTLASAVIGNYAFLVSSLSYDPNNVYLTVATQFARGARTANQLAVGTALDQGAAPTGDLAMVLGAMSTLDAQQGPAALAALSGQAYSGFGTANIAGSLMFLNTLGQQIAAFRGPAAGSARVALAEACEVACDTAEPAKWGAWMSGLGGMGSIGGNTNAGTFTYNFGGTAVGADYRVDPQLLVGVAAGYTSGRQWVDGFQGNGGADNYSAALYASFMQGGFYTDGVAGYAYSDNQLQRVIQIPGLAARIASGRAGANQFLGQVEAGYRIGIYEPATATLAPFARFQTVAVSQNGFSESGASSLNLSVAQQNTTSVRSVLGGDLAGNIPLGGDRVLTTTLRLGWAHEYADTARPMTAAFAGAPTTAFTIYGAQPLRDAAVIGLGLSTQIAASTSIYARYDGEITGRDDAHVFSAGLRMTW